jgi:hypothetical protein
MAPAPPRPASPAVVAPWPGRRIHRPRRSRAALPAAASSRTKRLPPSVHMGLLGSIGMSNAQSAGRSGAHVAAIDRMHPRQCARPARHCVHLCRGGARRRGRARRRPGGARPGRPGLPIGRAGFELCRHNAGAAPGGMPATPAADTHCIFCLAGGTLLGAPASAPDGAAMPLGEFQEYLHLCEGLSLAPISIDWNHLIDWNHPINWNHP